jgi:hypothetical protein
MANTTDIILQADALGATAVVAASSALAPDALRNRPQDALIVLMAGRELGFAPMQSLRMLSVIKGKVTLSADATVALVRRSGECVEWRCVETTRERATYTTRRKGDTEPTVLTWTIEQATRAGLVGGQGWRSYPEAMLRARCASALARIVYPDLVAGIYDPDELAAPLDAPRPQVETVRPVVEVKAEAVAVDVVEIVPAAETSQAKRRRLIEQMMTLEFDAPQFVEELLARDGVDLGTADLTRVEAALRYLGTPKGAAHLAGWAAARDEAMSKTVSYGGEE